MQRLRAIAMSLVLSGLLSLTLAVRDASFYPAAAHDVRQQARSTCPGFVILPNGFAVLSGTSTTPASMHMHHGAAQGEAKTEQMDHAMPAAAPKQQAHSAPNHAMPAAHPPDAQQHLMGYTHGEAIVLQPGMLCVSLGSPDDTAWMAVSGENSVSVMVESLRGALTHNSRDNEGFSVTMMQPGSRQPLEKAQVRLFVRMPQHDHGMPGGHGPANDPDVQGLVVEPDDTGRYTVQTVDFSMAGPWLMEMQIQQGSTTLSAYFAASVGEE
jgi:hypothetical protein